MGFLNWVENTLMPPMAKLGEQRHLKAIRDGVISTLSLILIGSFYLTIINLPIPAWEAFIEPFKTELAIPFRITTGLMSIYAAYGMGYSLARSYKLDGVTGGVLTLATFLMFTIPVVGYTEAGEKIGFVLDMTYLGGSGMFSAILSMLIAGELFHFFATHKLMIKLPKEVPASVTRSFEALIPGFVILTLVWFVRVILDFDINALLLALFRPLNDLLGNNLIGVLLPVLFTCLLWAAGVHGGSIIGSVLRPMWLIMLDDNGAALVAGTPATKLPFIAPEQFYQWFVYIGGAGATLAVCLLFLTVCKSVYLKQVGRFSIVPAIFNINEPLMFGAPMVMNPILAIPFVVAPCVITIISYFALKLGMVNGMTVNAAWTLPAPIGAFLSASNDWRAIILVLINLAVAVAIYFPFIKVYDKQMLAEEKGQVTEEQAVL